MGILMEYAYDVPLGRVEDSTSSDDRNVTYLVIVDAFDMDRPIR
jgi:hypothetical protein